MTDHSIYYYDNKEIIRIAQHISDENLIEFLSEIHGTSIRKHIYLETILGRRWRMNISSYEIAKSMFELTNMVVTNIQMRTQELVVLYRCMDDNLLDNGKFPLQNLVVYQPSSLSLKYCIKYSKGCDVTIFKFVIHCGVYIVPTCDKLSPDEQEVLLPPTNIASYVLDNNYVADEHVRGSFDVYPLSGIVRQCCDKCVNFGMEDGIIDDGHTRVM
jgi:hypothetical protein